MISQPNIHYFSSSFYFPSNLHIARFKFASRMITYELDCQSNIYKVFHLEFKLFTTPPKIMTSKEIRIDYPISNKTMKILFHIR